MKRLIPLLLTAIGGFVLIVAFFIPAWQTSGEVVAVWFDILASIAFILGGGNLLKVHLKKVSDRAAGWGYSGVTLFAFLATLAVGLLKVGISPAPNTEFYGELFAPVPLEEMPVFLVPGTIPPRGDGAPLPASVRGQLAQSGDEIQFRGWISSSQAADLTSYQDELEWQATVEELAEIAQPPEELRGKVRYHAEHRSLGYRGVMPDEDRTALEELFAGKERALAAVGSLYDRSRETHEITGVTPPPNFAIPEEAAERVTLAEDTLSIQGPMSIGLRDAMTTEWPNYERVRPYPADARAALQSEIAEVTGPFTPPAQQAFERVVGAVWTPDVLVQALNTAGIPPERTKSARQLLAERESGETNLDPTLPSEPAVQLNDEQEAAVRRFGDDRSMTVDDLRTELEGAGEFTAAQLAASTRFLNQQPTVGDLKYDIAFALLKLARDDPSQPRLTQEQLQQLTADRQAQYVWQAQVQELFEAAHADKFPWSGEYNSVGGGLYWAYEYLFQPLTATMFAMLAFYVASAAFRAFRAKNTEAILLLGTAFLILIAQTPAGAWLTSWVPDSFSALQADEMKRYIMSLFNTAGNRAIMIGIALGIAATSLKILLGVDRSYLGSGEE